MDEKIAKEPGVRFAGFHDVWKQRKLGDMLKEFSVKSKVEDQHTVLSSTNAGMEIRDGRVSGGSNIGYKIIDDGDLVLSPQNLWLGNININDIGIGLVSPSYKTFKFVGVDREFINPQLRMARMLDEYKNASTQGASVVRRNLEIDSFYQILVSVPSKDEQAKIGLYFKQLDDLIALYQHQLELMERYKKTMFQKMFPKIGSDIPEIRFADFNDAWESCKLGELGSVQTCKRIFKEETSEDGEIPFYKNGTLGLDPDSYISRKRYEEFKSLYPYPEIGDTLISVVGSIGRTAEYKGKDEYFQDSNVVWLKTDGSINKRFLRISYQVIQWLIEGSTIKHLYNDNILQSIITYPKSQDEQELIGLYFDNIDELITLYQRELDSTKELKKSMLQKMFV